jgi:hypothetical protein
MIHCPKRGEKKCKEAPEICIWKDNKCNYIIPKVKEKEKVKVKEDSIKSPEKDKVIVKEDSIKSQEKEEIIKSLIKEEKVKEVRCGSRKQKKCEEVPNICKWVNDKCIKIVKEKTVSPVKSKTVSPVKPKTVSPVKPKTVSPVKPKTVSPVKPKTVSPVKPNSPAPTKLFNLDNRHCMYYRKDNKKALKYKDTVNIESKLNKTVYDPKFVSKTNVHLGQRKLLLSEIQLLTEYYKDNKKHPIVLYVGAAPGTHLLTLSSMFPYAFFILYDGAKFDPVLKKYPNIFEIHEDKAGFVTTPVINALKSKIDSDRLVFISDIRLGDDDKDKFEHGVMRDMQLQEEWVEILRPKMSLLKFRMSYHMKHGDKLKYMKGNILYGIWPKGTSGESRLLVKQLDIVKKINYDFKDYEETMFFHNKYQRPYCFDDMPDEIKNHIFTKNNSYCPCYDCVSELAILFKYSLLSNQEFDLMVKMFREQNKKNALFKDKPELQKLLEDTRI